MSDFKTNRFGKVVLTGPFKYPRLNEPDDKFAKDGFGHYSVKVVLPADDEHCAALIAQIDAAWEENLEIFRAGLPPAKAKKLIGADKPYRPEEDKETGEETGNIEFNCKMKAGGKSNGRVWTQSPDLFDAQMSRLTETIGGGTVGRVSCFLSGWNSPNPKVGAGVSLKLRGVQVISLEHGHGSPEDMGFEVEEDGFVTDGVDRSAQAAPVTVPDDDESVEGDEGDGEEFE